MMKKKTLLDYEPAELTIINLSEADVITTSEAMGDGEDLDDKAWT